MLLNKRLVKIATCFVTLTSCSMLNTTQNNNSTLSKEKQKDKKDISETEFSNVNSNLKKEKNKLRKIKEKKINENKADLLIINMPTSDKITIEDTIEELVPNITPNAQIVLKKLSIIKQFPEPIQKKLIQSYKNWKGTKYKLGGDSEEGIDCSGLTRRIYREVFGIELPRNSREQVKRGIKISKENLKPGDIVYFKPEGTGSHTAVYLGKTLFINASTAKGVVISTLENTYWNKYFEFGIRTRNA